jgi:GT2 family glycosyltransferase
LFPNNTVQHAGIVLSRESPTYHVWRGRSPHDPVCFPWLQAVHNFSAVTAACLMARREVFAEVGGFDEAFSVDFNDVDFCLRVREAGYHNLCLPYVRLYHHEALTRGAPLATPKSARRHERELRLFQSRWWRYLDNDPCWSPHLSVADAALRLCAQPEAVPPPRLAPKPARGRMHRRARARRK